MSVSLVQDCLHDRLPEKVLLLLILDPFLLLVAHLICDRLLDLLFKLLSDAFLLLCLGFVQPFQFTPKEVSQLYLEVSPDFYLVGTKQITHLV